ncbi:hypothetical protein DPMN_133522 [Dreissena polymorpha]|uniref:Uncharacterized protein n=2 Tax=Dreissena polymorpha TaxID=45954 RepID=A0A9D4FUF5_DREPO|nr:hypothetical protein DPMN_133522 [Dreissena polymorpha]
MEIVTRGCRDRPREYEAECSPLHDISNPLLPGFDILFKMYDHFSMKGQICTSEQPHQFNLLIPESYVTTGSGKNSASCVSAIFEYTVLNGLFLILCLN